MMISIHVPFVMILKYHMIALAVGIVLDIAIGDPIWLPHPIRAIGALVSKLEKLLLRDDRSAEDPAINNRRSRIWRGLVLWVLVMGVTFTVTFGTLTLSYGINVYFGAAVEAVMTFYILAAGSLRDESMKVYHAIEGANEPGLSEEDRLGAARRSLSMIVGRDTANLDETGIIRAAVETVAENTSDGVIAPLLYVFFGGPVLGFCYKAVNTMDSMLGYRNDKYEYFGKVAARADDVANLLPSRISALIMIVSAWFLAALSPLSREKSFRYDPRGAGRIWFRDRYKHKSPNSAQTESVCAGALAVRLGGDNYYNGVLVKKPFIGDDLRPVERDDIKRAVRLMFATEILCTAVIFTITGLSLIFR